MNILHLPLKGVWYDMIEAGIKKEEYREITEYWIARLIWIHQYIDDPVLFSEFVYELKYQKGYTLDELFEDFLCEFACYTHIRFRYGYTKRTMMFKLEDISVGIGNLDWGAPDHNVFKLKLGDRIE